MKNKYPVFFEELFGNEGGFQDDPEDKGNYYRGELYGTIYGITARDHFIDFYAIKLLYDKKKISIAKELAMKFYKDAGYWNDLYNSIGDSSLAFKIFDFGVNAGPPKAIKYLQEILYTYWWYNLEQDGVFGPVTLEMTNKAIYEPPKQEIKVNLIEGESILYSYYVDRLDRYYRSLDSFWKFGKGWLARLKRVFNVPPDNSG